VDNETKPEKPNTQADHKSVAIGSIAAGGNIGDIKIQTGDTKIYQYASEDDVPLTSAELEHGLDCFAAFLPERAPVLQERFVSISKKLRATLGSELNELSPVLKRQRQDATDEMKLMCMEVLDISFRALCTGQNPPPYDSRPPFLGLIAFRPEDREFYFGRETLIQKLVERLRQHPFLAVMGSSGSGKSSLVMAGLITVLEAKMVYLTPSSTSTVKLREAQDQAESDSVFVIDQFEELFTLTRNAKEREQFVDALLELAKTNRVVITMRADFWGDVAPFKELKQSMQEHQELIAPMDTAELRSAVQQQADAVSLRFDPALIESILDKVEGEPGAMPLLQHALWMLWKRRHGLWLKADEYRAFGGVREAIASTAEEVYSACTDLERDLLRNIFLRLTRLDDSGEGRDTRRRVMIEELLPTGTDSSIAIGLLNKLADDRLIVKTENEAEVAHEALIRHWNRLTNWLNEDRDNLRLRESLGEDAREWERSNHDESLLNHRGGRLELAVTMSQNPRYALNPIEIAYLNACVEVRERARIEKEQQQIREVEAAKNRALLKAERRSRLVTIGMLLIAILLVMVLAYAPARRAWFRSLGKGFIQNGLSQTVFPAQKNILLGSPLFHSNEYYFYPAKIYAMEPFALSERMITNGEYLLCVDADVCSPPNAQPTTYRAEANRDHPVIGVTSYQASQFCEWLGLRLPTDKEWELSARAHTFELSNFYEWTSTSFEYDTTHPEQAIEWTTITASPPDRLTIRGGGTSEEQLAIRISQPAFYSDNSTGFRCAANR
jgi:hypothetical protein